MSEDIKSSTPDLSKILNLIMENPRLIEEISALAKRGEETAATVSEPVSDSETVETASEPTYPEPKRERTRERRAQLMSALKPYLSNERQKALDSMMTFADVLETMRGR